MLTLAFNIAATYAVATDIRNQLEENASSINGVEVLRDADSYLEMDM